MIGTQAVEATKNRIQDLERCRRLGGGPTLAPCKHDGDRMEDGEQGRLMESANTRLERTQDTSKMATSSCEDMSSVFSSSMDQPGKSQNNDEEPILSSYEDIIPQTISWHALGEGPSIHNSPLRLKRSPPTNPELLVVLKRDDHGYLVKTSAANTKPPADLIRARGG